jgi:hypothetical protein
MSQEEFVYVAIYTHKHGIDYAVYRTAEKAYEWGEDIAREYWEDFYPDDPMPEEKVMQAYFNSANAWIHGEWFTVERKQIEG